MIIAGIDEAGYGPLLGPLVVGCCAFVGTDPAAATDGPAGVVGSDAGGGDVRSLPCVWKRLNRYVSRQRSKSGKKIHVNDSKQVYSPSLGLKELERAVLTLVQTWTPTRETPGSAGAARTTASAPAAGDAHAAVLIRSAASPRSADASRSAGGTDVSSLDALLARLSPHCLSELAEHPWYTAGETEAFPTAVDGLPIRLFANALRTEMDRKQTRCVHLAARVVSERPFNRMLAQTRNKASVLFTQAATHLDDLLRKFGDQDLFIFCDRQGGRSSYGHLLRMMFEDWSLEILEEADGRSHYQLVSGSRRVQVLFAEKAEAQCLPVAAASMVSKYLREALMHRFNGWWAQHAPDVKPTAGYYNDGQRFLDDIAGVRERLRIRDEDLVRAK